MPDASGTPYQSMRFLSALEIGLNWSADGSNGLDRIFGNLARALPDFGVRVRGAVVGPADVEAATEGLICPLAPAGITLPERLINTRWTIARLVDSGEFNLVAAHFALHVAAAIDRLHGLPLVVHFHGPWSEESRCEGNSRIGVAAKHILEMLVYRRADRIIALSEASANLLCSHYAVPPERVRVVPGSVDLASFSTRYSKAEARLVLGWPVDRPILLAVRRLAARKGLERLIAALERLVRRQPDLLLCIVGRGAMERQLHRQVAEAGLQRHVLFLGFVPEGILPLAYRAADINVVPTAALEGFGLIAAEALAAGTPSMVTPVGGLPEVVSALSPDLVFPASCTEGMVAGLRAALAGELSLPDEAACRAYAASRFGTALVAARVAAVYREVAV